jgi:CRP/FNR family cyclic AMP-dependent transcriptional regulator
VPDPVEYDMLKEAVLFRDMTDEELSIVSKKIFQKAYKKGSTLFVEGMNGEILYIVAEGGVDIVKKTRDGDKCIATVGRGGIVGEMSLIDSGLRTATGRTNEDSKLIVVTKNSFNEMLDSDPKIAAKMLMALLKIINGRLRQTNKKFEE